MRKLILRLCNFVFGKQATNSIPRILILCFDLMLLLLSYIVSMVMVYVNGFFDEFSWAVDGIQFLVVLAVYLACFVIFRTYIGMIRYSGFNDIRKIITSCTTAFAVLVVAKMVVTKLSGHIELTYFPRYVVMAYCYVLTMMLMMVSRLTIRRIYNEFYRNRGLARTNVVVYGAGDGGILVYRALSQDTESKLKIVAFVDDNPKKVKKDINSVPIYSSKVLTADFIRKNRIEVMILAIPSLDIKRKNELVDLGLRLKLKVKTVPSFTNWIDGGVKSNQIADIKIEDLLGRDPIILGKENVTRELSGKVVMVTGAAGSIGSEICRQVMTYNPKLLVLLDQAESPMYDLQFELKNNLKDHLDQMAFVIANVKDRRRMKEVFEQYRPNVIYHAAAYKHVPFMEENPYEAVFVNVFGTKNIADLAVEYGAEKFVMISTDKAVNPTNVMGATKRIAEIYTQSRETNTKFVTTRFGNVLGSNGSVVPLFRKQLLQGGPLTVTDKRIIRYFMTIPEACSLVLEAGSIGDDDDVFVFDMGEPVRIYDLAQRMIELLGHPEIKIVEIGLRPGEKLYEELLATKENTVPTENKKIKRAKVRQYVAADVDALLDKLLTNLDTLDQFKIVGVMKEIVPEFVSNNSIFTQLDKPTEK